jgi:hypothetical protein
MLSRRLADLIVGSRTSRRVEAGSAGAVKGRMPSQTLLSHIVSRFAPRQWENVATEALHYLLQRPGADQAIRDVLAPSGFELPDALHWRTQAGAVEDSSIPDLVGDDRQGRHRVIIESKFWAGLTDNQPAGYLARQANQFADDEATQRILVFLAPARRLDLLAAEVRELVPIPTSQPGIHGAPMRASQGTVVVSSSPLQGVIVLSWSVLLAALEVRFKSTQDEDSGRDLEQLRGLCDRADNQAILPIGPQEVGADRGRRHYEYCDIVDRIVDRLVAEKIVDTKRLKATGAKGWYGRYVRSSSGHVLRLYVSAWRWGHLYPSPWWLRFWGASDALRRAVQPLHTDGTLPYLEMDEGHLYAALRPPVGIEGERIIAELSSAVARVCAALPRSREAQVPAEAIGDPTTAEE